MQTIAKALQRTVSAISKRSMFSKKGTNFLNIALTYSSEALFHYDAQCGNEGDRDDDDKSIFKDNDKKLGLQRSMSRAIEEYVKDTEIETRMSRN